MKPAFTVTEATQTLERGAVDESNEALNLARSKLFDLGEIEVSFDDTTKTIWSYMTPLGSPNFSTNMLRDIVMMQNEIQKLFSSVENSLKYFVFASKFPNVFNLGGDLSLFSELITRKDRASLTNYGLQCVRSFYKNYISLDLPIVTISLVQGDALGGGFESALSFNVIIAERSAKLGLPEANFGMFPGMGAHAKLRRLLGEAQAERMILSGKIYTAEELYDMGIVHVLADDGQGLEVANHYIKRTSSKHDGLRRTFSAMREVNAITLDELERVVRIWVDAALNIEPHNLRMMQRLSAAQHKLRLSYVNAPALAAAALR